MNKIAVYNGHGVSFEKTVKKRWLSMSDELDISVLNAEEFSRENLNKFDVVILPGGSGSEICLALHATNNRQNLIDWVYEGGKIMGVCAGMYALTKGYTFSLGLINFSVTDRPYWERGRHNVNLSLTEHGKKYLGLKRDFLKSVNYHNGPVVQEERYSTDTKILNTEVLAYFDSELVAKGSKMNLMAGSPAMIKNNYGDGLVIAVSPHLEATKKFKKIIIKILKQI